MYTHRTTTTDDGQRRRRRHIERLRSRRQRNDKQNKCAWSHKHDHTNRRISEPHGAITLSSRWGHSSHTSHCRRWPNWCVLWSDAVCDFLCCVFPAIVKRSHFGRLCGIGCTARCAMHFIRAQLRPSKCVEAQSYCATISGKRAHCGLLAPNPAMRSEVKVAALWTALRPFRMHTKRIYNFEAIAVNFRMRKLCARSRRCVTHMTMCRRHCDAPHAGWYSVACLLCWRELRDEVQVWRRWVMIAYVFMIAYVLGFCVCVLDVFCWRSFRVTWAILVLSNVWGKYTRMI